GGGHGGLIAGIVIVLLLAGAGGAWWYMRSRGSAEPFKAAEYYPDPPGAQLRIGGWTAPPTRTGAPPVDPPRPDVPGTGTTTDPE
ncbi:MAG TPA: hypothetical protein VG266_08465, partial [Candidatus Dormibacteraeota bacterium]|nr:hypothetical protein [Candidatus Dormibacteraeota bacterium]